MCLEKEFPSGLGDDNVLMTDRTFSSAFMMFLAHFKPFDPGVMYHYAF